MRLILASTSPRRREILSLLDIPFEVIQPQFEERVSPDISIHDEVLAFARGKAQSVSSHQHDALVIGSDTMIVLDGEKFGKPRDVEDARRMLRSFSGRTHHIFTAVAIIHESAGSCFETVEEVEVKMQHLSDTTIDRYIAFGESLDKAGAYSIQGEGAKLITGIRGDYLAAVGMPLAPIVRFLTCRGVFVNVDIDNLYRDKSFLNWQRF
jgi:septum formation protein